MAYNMIGNTMLSIYNQLVDRKRNFDRKEGVYFVVKLDGINFGYEKDGNTYHEEWESRMIKYYHIIFLSCRNVYVAISDEPKTPQPSEWKNTSNHDSCFRSEGIRDLSSLYFYINDEIYKNTPDGHKKAPIMGSVEMSLEHEWLCGPLLKFVKVETERMDDGYHNILTKIDIIKKMVEI